MMEGIIVGQVYLKKDFGSKRFINAVQKYLCLRHVRVVNMKHESITDCSDLRLQSAA